MSHQACAVQSLLEMETKTASVSGLISEEDFARWLLEQVARRKLSSDERQWLDRYIIHCGGKIHTKTRPVKGLKIVVLAWALTVAASVAFGVLSWM